MVNRRTGEIVKKDRNRHMSVEKVKLISDEGSPGNIPERSVNTMT